MSAPSNTHVTALGYDTTTEGAEVTLTVLRLGSGWAYMGKRANAADLPPDVADALRKWLEGAPGHQPPTPDESIATAIAIARGHLDADDACTTSVDLAETILAALEADA